MVDKKADATFTKETALVNEVGNIVARLQAGEDAFAEFYEKTKRYVYYIAISNGVTQNDAEDVVQDTFVHFFKKYKEIENPSSAMSWLKRSAFGHSIDCLKKKKDVCLAKDEDTEFDAFDTDALIQPIAIPETALEDKERVRIISEIVDSLPEDQKKCVLAYYYSECKIKDIAVKYGVPENTVKTNLSRGRKNIEKQLELFAKKHGVKLTSVAIIPFFALAYSEKAEACSVAILYSAVAQAAGISAGTTATTGTTATVATSLNAGVGAATKVGVGAAVKAGTGAAAKVGLGAALKAGGAIAAKGIAAKVAIAVISVGVIGGGTAAGITYANAEQARVEQKMEQVKKEEESKPVATVASNENPPQNAEESSAAEPNTLAQPATPSSVAERPTVAAPMSLEEELPSLQAEVEEDDDDDDDWDDGNSSLIQPDNELSSDTDSINESTNASGNTTNNTNAFAVAADGSVNLSNGITGTYDGNLLTLNSAGSSVLNLPFSIRQYDGSIVEIDTVNKLKVESAAFGIRINTTEDWTEVVMFLKNDSVVLASDVTVLTGVFRVEKIDALQGYDVASICGVKIKDTTDSNFSYWQAYKSIIEGTLDSDVLYGYYVNDTGISLYINSNDSKWWCCISSSGVIQFNFDRDEIVSYGFDEQNNKIVIYRTSDKICISSDGTVTQETL